MVKHLTMAIAAMVIYGALHAPIDRIQVADGAGWDGLDYALMLRDGWAEGGPNTQLRPLIVWLALPAYALTGSAARAFDITNYLYIGLLAWLFSQLMERYGASPLTRVIAVVCISASNASRLSVYYPVAIDLGGHALMTLALWFIIAGPRWAAGVTSVAAMLSREYAPVVVIFGVVRDLRLRVPLSSIVATYVPAALVYVVLRMIVVTRVSAEGNTLQTFVRNLELWTGPLFPSFYLYFLLTIAGGVSLVVAAQPRRWWRVIRDEPEWLGFAAPVAVAAALVGLDIWRYQAALMPLVVVLFAACSSQWRAGESRIFITAMVALTLITQTPFQGMDLQRFFTEWFPYYAWTGSAPVAVSRDLLWPDWGWRFLGVTMTLCALTVYANTRVTTATVTT